MASTTFYAEAPALQRVSPIKAPCLHCGLQIVRIGRSVGQHCSAKCQRKRKAALRGKRPPPRCLMCGGEFTRTSSAQKWCVSCKDKARLEYRVAYQKANHLVLLDEAKRISARARQTRRAQLNERVRKNREKNKDAINARRRTPEYRAHQAAYKRTKSAEPKWRLHNRISSAIYQAIRGHKAGRKWEVLVGYTLAQLVEHIERQFDRKMSWDNMGGWHIDHIIPRAAFTYETPDDPDFKACWALTNLRPCWAAENQAKAGKRTFLL